MKLRKGILSILIISLMIMIIGISTKVKAEMVNPPMYLGIEEYRKKDSNNKEYAYSVLDKIVWKITSYDDDERSNPNKNKTLYCIKPGQGFGSRLPDGTYVGRNEVRVYNQKFDLKNRGQIEGNYLNAIPSGETYNSLIWILENCYVPEIDTNGSDRQQLLNAAKEYNRNVLNIEDRIYFEKLTDEDIDVVQQLAIWQFTNNNADYQIPSNTFELYLKEKNKSEDYTSISNKFPTNDEGIRRNEAAIALYNYLIGKARENGSTEPLPTTTQNPIYINTTNSKIELEGENYILGPYSINEITHNIEYTLEATLKNGETPVAFKILNTNKAEVGLKDVVGSQFYISVLSSQYASGLKFNVTTKTNEKTLTYWSVNNAPLTDQPVVEIGKIEKSYAASITTPNIPKEKTFDLALRKFITKINDTKYDRIPKTSPEQLAKLNNGTWTVEKEHTKVPLIVKTGDRVLYTIRIYNEGEINGKATKITDYLPVGLRYIQDSQINRDNGWTVSSDGRTVVTQKLAGTIINAFDGTTLDYKDVQIECEVIAIDTGADKILKNIAEITECKDENGNSVTDRDSIPADLTEDQKKNYNPGESEKGWGYYDDDDYEDLKMPGKVFDLALRKFITKINETQYDREPKTTKEQLALLNNGKQTVEKEHTKEPIIVKTGDRVLYTIRIYNEGEMNGKATRITDYLPIGLKFIEDSQINKDNGWTVSSDGRTVVTEKLSGTIINAFDGTTLDYKDVQIECEVIAIDSIEDKILKNVAEITACTDAYGNSVTDRDSVPGDLTEDQKKNYNPGESEKGWGYYDDDDYEDLRMPGREFDLALRKFITKINETEYDREPKTTKEQLDLLNNGKQTVEKEHTKEPIIVKTGDRVLYTIRIYNEGEMNGKATKITDYLPVGLKFIEDSQINKDNGWTVSSDGRTVATEKLSGTIINAFDGTTLDYKDVQIECEVIAIDSIEDKILKNVAEITACTDAYGNSVTDRDSVPGDLTEDQKKNYNPGESEKGWGYYDDDDYEDLRMPGKEFDLALRKFVSKINETQYDREPKTTKEQLDSLNNGKQTVEKEHTKEPIIVKTGDRVLYTIRIYNEGRMNGKATKITDYLPVGLKFIEDSQINKDNGWTVSSDGRTVATEKLSGTIINAFDGTTLDYKDVQIECEVIAIDSIEDKILKNVAEITACTDAYGNSVTDRDSVPGDLTEDQKKNYNPGESEKGWGYYDDDDYEDLKMPGKQFDLSLRKFITQVDEKQLVDNNGKYIKEPVVDITQLKAGTATTATYKHQKAPVGVSENSEVIYTIRIYNEGQLDGYVTEITDYLPPELEFVNDEFNAGYGWTSNGRVVKTDITSPNTKLSSNQDTIYAGRNSENEDKVLLKAFDGEKLDYIDVKIKCKVVNVEKLDTIITNIAEITAFTDSNGNTVIDRDSTADSLTNDNSKDQDDIKEDNLPLDTDLPDYKGRDTNKSILTDSTYHYKGQQDDDDFDKLILQEFDLSLRKFITAVNDEKVTNRYPVFTTNKDENGNYIYVHTKEPIEVETTDLVEYTIRIYNEGNVAGYAKEVKDNIPNGLEFVPESDINKEYRWKMLDEEGNETNEVSKAKYITTDYLSKEQEEDGENIIKGFDQETMGSPEYKDVKVVFKVIAPSTHEGIITNIAEISDDSDENGNSVIDKDSEPDNNDEKEDDIDVEHIKLSYFDLALRKFITAVNENEITNRYPQFSIDENGNYIYTHTKQPVEVENGNIVTYTLRIYNEGTKAGYAKQVKDDLPEGLEFLPENELNKQYRWVMLDEEGKETDELEKAVSISTDYLSKAQETEGKTNLLKPFDKNTMEEPDHRDVKIAFKVTEPNTSDRILINKAQIADDEDKDGKPVIDIDSTPDKWIEGEDDQDIEKVKVKYFDLALRKWVTQAIVIENGKERVIETGHKAEDDPEEVVKVEIEKSKINKVVVKFRYKIRVTNEGEIPGYATEISDYIPQGLKFVAADNKNWKEVDGKIVTNELANTLLKPGESSEVEVLLTWINGNDNMGLKVNTAEISKDKNDSNTPDIDSTPNNKKPGEDDIDDAPVILATKTGELINLSYVGLVTGALAIIIVGVVAIKKYIL